MYLIAVHSKKYRKKDRVNEQAREIEERIKKKDRNRNPKKKTNTKYRDDNVEDIKSGHTNKNIVYICNITEFFAWSECCEPYALRKHSHVHMYMYVCRYLTSNRNQIPASIQIRVDDLNRDQRYIYLCMYVRKMKKNIMLLGLLKMVLPYAIAKRMWHALRYSTRSKISLVNCYLN